MALLRRTESRLLDPVSVIMAVHNGQRYIVEALDSILHQTHQDFEIIIIDDGSTDRTSQIVAQYAARDKRIEVIFQENLDQPASLNRALAVASNEWVAVLDTDDVCMLDRLETQLRMLRREPSVRVLGSSAILIDHAGQIRGLRHHPPSSVAEYERLVRENRSILAVHPSVMMHRPTIMALGGYDSRFGAAADAELWSRVSDNHAIVNLREPLIYYRLHSDSMSVQRFFEQQRMFHWIETRQEARRRGLTPPDSIQIDDVAENGLCFHRLNQYRQAWGKYLGLRGRTDWWRGKYTRALLKRTGATILSPRATVKRFMSST
jgi:glycosyltransferase involved in cell wall biosynthesis